MVCAFCGTRNVPHAATCAHCGVLLRGPAASGKRPAAKRRAARRRVGIGLAVAGGAALGVGIALPFLAVPLAMVGGLGGAGLGFGLSAGKRVYRGNLLRARHAALSVRLKNALAAAEHRYETELKQKENTWEGRLHLALAHLLDDEYEKSWSEFEQARVLDAPEDEWLNNAGVSLAQRGEAARAVELFEKAASPVNLAHAWASLAAGHGDDASEKAIREIQRALASDGKNPSHYNRLGLILCGAGRVDEALTHFGRALELADNSPGAQADARSNRGLAYAREGQTAEADAEFEAALKLDPGHGRALGNRGVLRLRKGELEGALETLNAARALDDKDALLASNLGVALCRSGFVNDGILAFRDALLIEASLFEAHVNLGKVYADAHQPEMAERHLQRALSARPRHADALTTMGVVKALLGQIPLAARHFSRANELRHNQPRTLMNLALCETLTENFADAERHFHQAAHVDKTDPEPGAHLGWMLLKQGNLPHADDELKLALAKNEKMAHAHNNYGLCQIFEGNNDGALLHFKRALYLDPSLTGVHHQIGGTHALLGNIEAAVKSWETAGGHEPSHIDNFVNLGVGYYKLGKYDEAVKELARVVNARQERMHDFSNLGLAYAKQGMEIRAQSRHPGDAKARAAIGKHKQAVEQFDKALAIEPANVMLHSNRGLACFFANRPEDAMEEWGAVTRLNPGYARKRAKVQQSEFDDTQIHFLPINFAERALAMPFVTADYLTEFAPGYDADDWMLTISDPALAQVPAMKAERLRLERRLHALKL